VAADVTDPEAVEALVERAADTGRVDAVVNVAGIVAREPLATHDGEPWERSVAVNLTAPFRIAREAAPHLRKTGGAVVNISSIYGQIGAAERAGYASTKAGIEGLTRALAAELGEDGVRANAVAPGFIETPMTEPYAEDDAARERFRELAALERLGGRARSRASSPSSRATTPRSSRARRSSSTAGEPPWSESVGGRRRSTGGGDYGPF